MTAYYMERLPDSVLDIVISGYTPGLSQDGDGVEERELIDSLMLESIPMMVERGNMVIYHEGNIVYMLRRKTAWVAQVDIFIGEEGTLLEAISVGRKAIKWAAENTLFHKIEARSPMPAMKVLAKRLGFDIEGKRKESFKTTDGEMVDEIEAGLVIRSQSCLKSH